MPYLVEIRSPAAIGALIVVLPPVISKADEGNHYAPIHRQSGRNKQSKPQNGQKVISGLKQFWGRSCLIVAVLLLAESGRARA